MDSLALLEVPALGYGIRYEFGISDQVIRDGWQCEITDKWLKNGNLWDIARSPALARWNRVPDAQSKEVAHPVRADAPITSHS